MATVVVMASVTASVLGGIDERVWSFFVAHPFLIDTAKNLTDLGSMRTLVPLSVGAGILLWWRYRSLMLAITPWMGLQFNSSFVAVLKRTSDVVRPPKSQWLAGAAGGSFPSGHVANTSCLLIAVALIVFLHETSLIARRCSVICASAGIVLMAWTRLALNVHWLSDVMAGAIVGIVVATGTVATAMFLKSRREIPLRTRDQLAS